MECSNCDNELDISDDFEDFIATDEGEYWDVYRCKNCGYKTLLED